jgi:hypothetical protein
MQVSVVQTPKAASNKRWLFFRRKLLRTAAAAAAVHKCFPSLSLSVVLSLSLVRSLSHVKNVATRFLTLSFPWELAVGFPRELQGITFLTPFS